MPPRRPACNVAAHDIALRVLQVLVHAHAGAALAQDAGQLLCELDRLPPSIAAVHLQQLRRKGPLVSRNCQPRVRLIQQTCGPNSRRCIGCRRLARSSLWLVFIRGVFFSPFLSGFSSLSAVPIAATPAATAAFVATRLSSAPGLGIKLFYDDFDDLLTFVVFVFDLAFARFDEDLDLARFAAFFMTPPLVKESR